MAGDPQPDEVEWAGLLPEQMARLSYLKRQVLLRLLLKQGSLCYYCQEIITPDHPSRRVQATIDHYIPKAKGGTDDEDNLVAACKRCNELKADQMPEDYIAGLKRPLVG